ncbi:MAG TPA: acetylxylan esterase [Verrucomicrobiaceae bacterium]|jgi:cephalosporin-C deacetylase-like acetyl esterase
MSFLRILLLWSVAFLGLAAISLRAEEPAPTRELRDLNQSYFPFTPVKDKAAWDVRREDIKRRILVASGLWPMPEKTPLNPVIHGRIERDDYTIEKVFFESLPGNFVTGNLYLPKQHGAKIPAVICPHGHWPNGRFMHASDAEVKKQIAMGAEKMENAAHSPLQARCVQLARMGCAVFFYDMLGCADSVQFCDASGKPEHRHAVQAQGFLSPTAELNLCGYFPLQTWNSVRVLDFISSLPYVDTSRLGCTGASGGGTQTLIITAIDDRVTASFPCVMTSTAMQGGCTCENSNYLRIGQGNIDIAALAAPRPLGMTAADDWTKELETKGFPDLKNLYTMLGVPDRVEAHGNIKFPHNYNAVSRGQMYAFFNKYFGLGLSSAALEEKDFKLSTTPELSVWDDTHPAPSGNQTGTAHEVAVMDWFQAQSNKAIAPLGSAKSRGVLESALRVMVGCKAIPKGASAFALGTKDEKGDHLVMRGVTNCEDRAVDGTFVYPRNWNNAAVLWLSLKGEESIINPHGELSPAAGKLLQEGYAIACPKLYLQGATKNPNVYANRKRKVDGTFEGFAGYQYGYNPSLFAERVCDALAMIAMIRDNEKHRTDRIVVAGVEGAGAIAAAAAALSEGAVSQVVADLEGFNFAGLNSAWDVNFLPGAVKYGDVPGILSLCSTKTTVLGQKGAVGAEAVARRLVEEK